MVLTKNKCRNVIININKIEQTNIGPVPIYQAVFYPFIAVYIPKLSHFGFYLKPAIAAMHGPHSLVRFGD